MQRFDALLRFLVVLASAIAILIASNGQSTYYTSGELKIKVIKGELTYINGNPIFMEKLIGFQNGTNAWKVSVEFLGFNKTKTTIVFDYEGEIKNCTAENYTTNETSLLIYKEFSPGEKPFVFYIIGNIELERPKAYMGYINTHKQYYIPPKPPKKENETTSGEKNESETTNVTVGDNISEILNISYEDKTQSPLTFTNIVIIIISLAILYLVSKITESLTPKRKKEIKVSKIPTAIYIKRYEE